MKLATALSLLLFPFFTTAQLNPAQLWKAAEPVGNIQVKGPSLLVDKDQNVFMITDQTNLNPFVGFSLVKYDSLGEKKWLQRHSPLLPNIYGDGSYVMDKEGDVHIGITTGGTWPGIQNNLILLKYNTYGTLMWEEPYGASEFSTDNVITHLAVDTLGHLYALGYTADPNPEYNWLFVFCFDISNQLGANKLWRIDIPGVHLTQGFRLLGDRLEALSTEFRLDGKHFVISQIDFNGNVIQSHAKPYSSPYLLDFNYISEDGSVVFGNRWFAYRAVKVDVQGDTIWDYNLPPVASDQNLNVLSIVEDKSLNTYITGCHNYPDTYVDAVTTKLDTEGNVVWQDIYTLQSASSAECFGKIVVDSSYVYVIGNGTNPDDDTHTDALILLYDKDDGENLAELRFSHNDNVTIPNDIYLLEDGFVVVCVSNGDVTTPTDSTEVVTYRFRVPKTSKTDDIQKQSYIEAYPNPAQDYCFVAQDAGRPFKNLAFYDLSGKQIKSQPFPHLIEQVDVSGFPPGQYVLKASGDGVSAVAKIVVVR